MASAAAGPMVEGKARRGGDGAAAGAAVQQCGQLQSLIDISLSSLRGLRTKCAASNDLTQQEIRTLEVRLVRYINRQRQCKLSVPLNDRTVELNSYPRFNDWLDLVNVKKEVVQRIPEELTLDALLDMNESKVKETMKRCGASDEECSRLNGALTCLRKVTESGGELKEDLLWNNSDVSRESTSALPAEPFCPPGPMWTSSLLHPSKGNSQQARSVSVSAIASSESLASSHGPSNYADNSLEPLAYPSHSGRVVFRTPHSITITPPTTPQLKRRHKLKPPRTPPPPSRKVFQLLPNFPTLTRSKSHESQLGNRIDEVPPLKLDLPQASPQAGRRDIGLSVTHRFSTKSWLSQMCHVCQKSMMFGVKCKYCRLKCHNKCTKEAPACRISFLPIAKIRRTESVPSDINNPVDRPTEPQFGTLPKALTKKEHPPAISHLDSSSNPSSTTSSTPSSPAPFQSSNPPSATPPPNPSPMGQRDCRFNFPAAYYIQHRQQFIFPEIPSPLQVTQPPETAEDTNADEQLDAEGAEEPDAEVEEQETNKSEPEYDEDELDDLPKKRTHWQGMISRKASQTSVYLQEWDIPFEQIELGEPIGQGRWGKVYRGKWHGEVAIRLLQIDGNNQDHLKLFKKEVMNYRQTRHENVVLFMGACMHPPHLAIITSFCKGRTLYSFVRDPKVSLDINKTRQIAQEIIKGMGYLHAKGIVHKDLKSKNVFYDNGKVVITDFGLFGISGVVQEGRRENELKLPHDWLCYLAPEIVREMSPGKDEDKLPFSKAADVYAFGTVWYELQAREWPFKSQPAEALIWQIGSGEGVKHILTTVSVGKEVSEILSACWSFDLNERPSFTLLVDMLEKLPKLNRRLSHPGHFWKSAEIAPHGFIPTMLGIDATAIDPLAVDLSCLLRHDKSVSKYSTCRCQYSSSCPGVVGIDGRAALAYLTYHAQDAMLVPFTGPICGGLCDGMMVTLSGTVVQDCDRFRINFESVSCQNPQDDTAFYFNPRFEEGGYVVCNTFENQSWLQEEKKYAMPFLKGHPFQINILVEHDSFMVFVNGKQFVEYKHRMPLSKVNAIGVAGGVELSVISFQKITPGVIFLPELHQPQPYSVPYCTSMAGGLYPSKSVIITGTIMPKADRFHVDLKQNEDIAFHLNPRFSAQIIVRNTRLNQYWGSEERGLPSGMPFVRGQNFAIWIVCDVHCFKVAVNGQHQFDYNYRVSNLQQINLLEIGGDVLLTCVQV